MGRMDDARSGELHRADGDRHAGAANCSFCNMNESLSKFLDQAQLHAVLGFVSACARALLAPEADAKESTAKKIGIVLGSVMLAVTVAYAVEMVETVKKWAPLAALAAGMVAQDLLMRITRRSGDILDAAEDRITGPKLSTKNPRPNRHDNDYE
jgi:hypothetical protein